MAKKSVSSTIINWAFTLSVWGLILAFLVSLVIGIIIDIKVINKIKEPENCIIVDGDYYCKEEL